MNDRGRDWHDEDTLPSIPSPPIRNLHPPDVRYVRQKTFAAWLVEGAWSFGWRTAVTVAATWTVYQLMQAYYRIDFGNMLIAAAVVLLVTRIWAKWP